LCFGFLVRRHVDLSSPTKDRTSTLYTGRQSLNYSTARKVPIKEFLKMKKFANKSAYFSKKKTTTTKNKAFQM
jgi:hypothetical protein